MASAICVWFSLCVVFVAGTQREYQVLADKMGKCYDDYVGFDGKDKNCNELLDKSSRIENETSCLLSVFDALPTQYTVGMSTVNCKSKLWEIMISSNHTQEFIKYQNKNPTPGAVFYNPRTGKPGIYIINHQHLAFSLAMSNKIDEKYKYLKVCIVNDYRVMYQKNDSQLFWDNLISHGFTLTYDRNRNYLNPNYHMPTNILDLQDDPFRSLSRYSLDYFGYVFCSDKIERVDHMNFSLCFEKHLNEWKSKYKYIGISLAWSNFYYSKYSYSRNIEPLMMTDKDGIDSTMLKNQMDQFRQLLPIAINMSLYSRAARLLPSFNNQPWKTDFEKLVLFDDGCDLHYQSKIDKLFLDESHLSQHNESRNDNKSMDSFNIFFMWVAALGVILLIVIFHRCYHRYRKLDKQLTSLVVKNDTHIRSTYDTFDNGTKI